MIWVPLGTLLGCQILGPCKHNLLRRRRYNRKKTPFRRAQRVLNKTLRIPLNLGRRGARPRSGRFFRQQYLAIRQVWKSTFSPSSPTKVGENDFGRRRRLVVVVSREARKKKDAFSPTLENRLSPTMKINPFANYFRQVWNLKKVWLVRARTQ